MRLHSSAARCAAFSIFFAGIATHAAEPLNRGADFYWGANLGAVAIKPDHLRVDSKGGGDGRVSGGVFLGVRVANLPVSGGWPAHLELGYQNIARHTIRYKVQSTTSDLTASGNAVFLAGRVGILLTADFGLYGKLGVAHTKVTGSTLAGQPAIPVNGKGSGLLHAFGVEYQYDSGPILRGEISNYSKTSGTSSAAALTVGMGFRF